MAETTKIQWSDATWNIARGCTKVDEDCKYCYMYRESMNNTRYNASRVVKTKTVFDLPLRMKTPSKIFTSSLTDVFHKDCDSFREEMWDIIRRCPQHTFQILTKRPERISECLPKDWGEGWDNVLLGTSCGSQKALERVFYLIGTTAKKRFLSLEPLWDEIILNGITLNLVDWIIVGGESGNETGRYLYRPCKLEWIENIVERCRHFGIPVFVKQLGTYLAKEMKLKDRHGGNIDEFPKHLQIREFPKSAENIQRSVK